MLVVASTTFFACSDDDDKSTPNNGEKPTGKYEITVGDYNADAHTLKISWKAEQDAEYNWTVKEGDQLINTQTTNETIKAGIQDFELPNLNLEYDTEYTFELSDINGKLLQTIKFTLKSQDNNQDGDTQTGDDLKIKIESIETTAIGPMTSWTIKFSWEAKKMTYNCKLIKSSDNTIAEMKQKECETAGKVEYMFSPSTIEKGAKYKIQLFDFLGDENKVLGELEFTAEATK